MTEKFTICNMGLNGSFIKENGKIMDIERVVDLLNKLHEENERLKKYNNKLMKQPLLFDVQTIPNTMEIMEANNKLEEENKQLKQYKQSVNDVLRSWSQKNLTAKQLQVVLAIMEELNVMGDV